jgi:hypothetical protein
MDEVKWHNEPEEYDNDDDEAENLHYIIEDVSGTEIETDEIKSAVS